VSDNLTAQNISPNPLHKHFRQPKIYITLPSQGKWYPPGAIDYPENGELPVLPMTAKDEISMRTPDALLNGQSTVDIIQNCIPNIKNAWVMPVLDIDTCLTAIRIATYGEKMPLRAIVPNTDIEKEFNLDLRQLLDTFKTKEFVETLSIDGFVIQLRPVSYKNFSDLTIKTFEEQRLVAIASNEDIEDSQKIKIFNNSFKTLTEINMNLVVDSIVAIQYQNEEPVTNSAFIREFIENSESSVFNAIKDHIDDLKMRFESQPLEVQSTPEEIEAGAPETYSVPVVMDHSNFFGLKS
jgi:hypothetical protein